MATRNVTKSIIKSDSVRARLTATGISIHWNAEWQEYSVRLASNKDAEAFTTDKEGAADTAIAMMQVELARLARLAAEESAEEDAA